MRIALFSTALLASAIASAATPIDGLYGSVFGGYSYIPDNVTATRQGLTRNFATYYNGYNVGGRIGYQSNPIRYEGEVTYTHGQLKRFKVSNILQTTTSGNTYATFAMANIYYDFPDMVPAISPFIGAGIGYAWVNVTLDSTVPFTTTFNDSDTLFAYQGTAGFTYNFADSYAVNLSYRYLSTSNSGNLGKIYQVHMANIGAIYRFDEGEYK